MTVVGAGVTLEEAIKAHDELKGTTNIRVVDPFTLKPIDKDLLIQCARETGGLVVTVEDHYDQGMAIISQMWGSSILSFSSQSLKMCYEGGIVGLLLGESFIRGSTVFCSGDTKSWGLVYPGVSAYNTVQLFRLHA